MFKKMVDYPNLSKSDQQVIDSLDKHVNTYCNLIAQSSKDELKTLSKSYEYFLRKGLSRVNAINKFHNVNPKSHYSNYSSNTTNNNSNKGLRRIWITDHTSHYPKPKVAKITTHNHNKLTDQKVWEYLTHKHGVDRE